MNKKDLEKLGFTAEMLKTAELPDDVLEKVIILHGKDIESHKTKITTLETERDGLNTQLADANTAIEGFKKLDPEGIQKASDEWKTKAEAAEAAIETGRKEAEKTLEALKYETALDAALVDAKVVNPKAVRALLDTETIVFKGGKFTGLDEQFTALKESDPNQFSDGEEKPTFVKGGNNKSIIGDKAIASAREAAGLPSPKGE